MTNLSEINQVLEDIDFPVQYRKEITSICIVALLDGRSRAGLVNNNASLSEGARIKDIIEFSASDLNRYFATNTRESFRKESLKPMVDFGIAIKNSDDPNRPTNSGNTNYILTTTFANLVVSKIKSDDVTYKKLLKLFQSSSEYSRHHNIDLLFKQQRVNINIQNLSLTLSPGLHNVIEKYICEELLSKYTTPDLVYIADTDDKQLYHNDRLFEQLHISLDAHSKIPDIIAYDATSNHILIYEAIASSGPITKLRKKEIDYLLKDCLLDTEYYTVFKEGNLYKKYANQISPGSSVFIIDDRLKIDYTIYNDNI